MIDLIPKYRVLIVDDQRDVRRMLRAGIETLGENIQVTDVPSGEEAILVISRQPVDLLVVDVILPGISGLELKERAQIRNPGLKFILMTGIADESIRQDVAEAGADAYYYKPIEVNDFLETVQRLLGITQSNSDVVDVEDQHAEREVGRPGQEAGETTEVLGLSDLLSGLRQEIDAVSAVLLDDAGQVMAQAGNLPEDVRDETLVSSLMTTFSASAKVSNLLGNGHPVDFMYFAGQEVDLFLSHVGQSFGLLVVVKRTAWGNELAWKLMQAIQETATDLSSILSKIGVFVIDKNERPMPETPEQENAPDGRDLFPELEELFDKAKAGEYKPEEVDAFWDTATEENPEEVTRADAISYEQARKLGLAPDDG